MAAYRKAAVVAATFVADAVAQGLIVGTAAKWVAVGLHAVTLVGVFAVPNRKGTR